MGLSPLYREKVLQIRKQKIEVLKKMIKAGVTLGCGSDFLGGPLCPHGKNALELVLQQTEAGRKPAEILASATGINARALGLENETGLLKAGLRADFLILEGNPLEDVGLLLDRNGSGRWSRTASPSQNAGPSQNGRFLGIVHGGSEMKGEPMLKKGMQLHPKDNVMVVLEAVKAGDTVAIQPGDGTLVVREDINFGHKLALVDIGPGDVVVKYGNPMGKAEKAISKGFHVHVHNISGLRVDREAGK